MFKYCKFKKNSYTCGQVNHKNVFFFNVNIRYYKSVKIMERFVLIEIK